MSAAEQSALGVRSPRRIPSSVLLGPWVLNALCAPLRDDPTERESIMGQAGLLFGTAEQDLVTLESVKPFTAADSTEDRYAKRESWDAAFQRLLATVERDPELSSLHLVGWYCVRGAGDMAPLAASDMEFHNRRFRRATDLALVLKPQQQTGVSIELYSRSSLNTPISRQDFRSGSLHLGVEADLKAAILVTMRATVDDDYYLRVFQVLDSVDRAERKQRWKSMVLSAQRLARSSLTRKWRRTPGGDEVDTAPAAAVDAAHTAMGSALSILAPSAAEVNGLPVHSTPTVQSSTPTTPFFNQARGLWPSIRAITARAKPAWIPSAMLLVLVTGVALAWTYARPMLSSLPGQVSFLRLPATTRLDMRVEPQRDSSLLLRWNAQFLAVQSAKGGLLEIDDGSERRKLNLDLNQVANGSILYTPISKDLIFRLEVFNDRGSPISETMRVVNGSKSVLPAHGIPNAPPKTLAIGTRGSKGTRAFQRGDTTSQRKATLPSTQKPSHSKIVGAERASLPDINASGGRNAAAPALHSQIAPEAPFPTPLAAKGGQPGTAVPKATRAPIRKALEAERHTQTPNPAIVNSAESSAGERSRNRTHSSSRKPELRKPIQELASAQSPLTSASPPIVKSSSAKPPSKTYVTAQPVKRVMPNTSTFSRSLLASIDVDVEVKIDTAGFVTDARVVNPRAPNQGLMDSRLLESAALASAREWIFEPAKVDGRSVASNHTITFHFRPR